MVAKRALVIGGTSGIGLRCVKSLVESNVDIIAVGKSMKHKEDAEKIFPPKQDINLKFVAADMSQSHGRTLLEEELNKTGWNYLDYLVNSAGTINSCGIESETLEGWSNILEANLTSVFMSMKISLPLLKKSKIASIVNVSSVCSIRTCTSVSYSVSKAGVDMLTKCSAKDLAKFGIRVNCVNPGVVESNLQISAGLFSSQDDYEKWSESMKASHPLGRIGTPNDVVEAIMFFLSERSSWITGAVLSVDGGRSVA